MRSLSWKWRGGLLAGGVAVVVVALALTGGEGGAERERAERAGDREAGAGSAIRRPESETEPGVRDGTDAEAPRADESGRSGDRPARRGGRSTRDGADGGRRRSGESGRSGGGRSGGGRRGGSSGAAARRSLEPLPAGTYRYDTRGHATALGSRRDLPGLTTLEVRPADGRRQRSIRDLRDSDGEGSVTESTLEYADDGVYLTSVEARGRFAGIGMSRTLRPEDGRVRVAAAEPRPGDSGSYTLTGSGLRVRVSYRWVGFETLTIAGESVRTLRLDTTTTLSGDFSGNATGETWFTDRGIPAKEHVEGRQELPVGELRSELTATLRSLSPG